MSGGSVMEVTTHEKAISFYPHLLVAIATDIIAEEVDTRLLFSQLSSDA